MRIVYPIDSCALESTMWVRQHLDTTEKSLTMADIAMGLFSLKGVVLGARFVAKPSSRWTTTAHYNPVFLFIIPTYMYLEKSAIFCCLIIASTIGRF
jgi:hypothetical protein